METTYPIHNCIPDVSKYQGNIDWTLAAKHIDFAIIRVQDNTVLDSKLKRNVNGATHNDVPYALYAYFRAGSEAEAVTEADLFYDRAMAMGAQPILWYIDVEKKTAAWKNQRAALSAYAARLRKRGAERLGLYTFNAMFPRLKTVAGLFDDLWIAHYGKNIGVPSGYPTHPCGLHQYTSMAGARKYEQYGVPGIESRVDLNRLTGQKPLAWYTRRTYAQAAQLRVTRRTVYVRFGPGKGWKKLGVARKGTILVRQGEDHDGWYGVRYEGAQGYISAKYAVAA